jgi:DHA1 family bicyclomycin/chloramphenicol resistance-like MFS transporter
VLTTAPFVALAIAVTFNFAAVFLYIVSAPVFLIQHLHVSETGFLWLFGPSTLGIVAGAWLSGRAAGRLTRRQTVWWGYGIMTAAVVGNVLLNLLVPAGLPWSVMPIFVYFTGSALAMPSLTLMALDLFPQQRGLAASCQGFIQTSGNALATAVVAPLVWASTLTLAAGQAAMLAVGLAAFILYLRLAGFTPVTAQKS